MNENKISDKGMFGCLAIVLFAVLAVVVSIAVGWFFGAGFGLIALAVFLVYAIICVMGAFVKAGK